MLATTRESGVCTSRQCPSVTTNMHNPEHNLVILDSRTPGLGCRSGVVV